MDDRLLYHLIGDRIQSDAIHKATLSMGMFCDNVIGIRTIDDQWVVSVAHIVYSGATPRETRTAEPLNC